jgi:hypothetical protein
MDFEPVKRGPGRPHKNPATEIEAAPAPDTMRNQLRPDVRVEDPREAAAKRTAEILAQLGDNFADEHDKFFVPPEIIPDGWTYEWKNWTIHNKEDAGYVNGFLRTGWSFVPAKRPGHEIFLPSNWKEDAIIKDQMVLVERPTEICELVKSRMLKHAREQVRIKDDQLNSKLAPGMDRTNNGQPIDKMRRSVGPIPD